MPSTALQSRIAAFESIAVSNGKHPKSPVLTSRSPSPSPPNLGRKTSLIDLKDWIVDDGPTGKGTMHARATACISTEHEAKRQLIAPLIQLESPPRSRAKSSPRIPSAAPPLPPRKPSLNSLKSSASSASLVSLVSNNGTGASHRSDTLSVDRAHTYPPHTLSTPRDIPKHAPASSISSFHSVSLSSDTDPSTPGSISNFIATFPMDYDRKMSGFTDYTEADSISLAESYEEVSTPSLASPVADRTISHDWAKIVAKRSPVPPKLPQRPSSTTSSSGGLGARPASMKSPPPQPSSSKSEGASFRGSIPSPPSVPIPHSAPNTPPTSRRMPPPPPPHSRSSDRASIQSFGSSSSYSSGSTLQYQPPLTAKRPTPVPAAARVRYVTVFNANVIQQRKADKQKQKEKEKEKPALLSPSEAKKTRQAAGWRGLSVDLITGGEELVQSPPSSSGKGDDEVDDTITGSERLDGLVVRAIWRPSKLHQTKLRDIWNDCDPSGAGSLDQDAFVRGMWRIDEELRRANRQVLQSGSRVVYRQPRPLLQ